MTEHRRIKVRPDGLLFEGLYDTVVDTKLHALLQSVRAAGIKVTERNLLGSVGRLIARELAAVVLEAIEARLNSDDHAESTDIVFVNKLLELLRKDNPAGNADLVELLPRVLRCAHL